MLPLLQVVQDGREHHVGDVVTAPADKFNLTGDERSRRLPSGRAPVIRNRTHGAMTDLTRAGLLVSTRRGHFRITERGLDLLAMKPASINSKFMRRYPELVAFVGSSAGGTRLDDHDEQAVNATGSAANRTPEEVVVSAHAELGATLRIQLLDRVVHSDPAFVERLVVTLLLAMGFGGGLPDAGRAIGGSGDGGIDGVTDQDALGRDRVYIQAKRHRPENAIGPKEIQAFFGALNMAKAAKGVFITTSSFTRAAQETAEKQGSRIVLIDGDRLTQLMIRYDVGVRIEQAFHIKKIDEDFFLDEGSVRPRRSGFRGIMADRSGAPSSNGRCATTSESFCRNEPERAKSRAAATGCGRFDGTARGSADGEAHLALGRT